MDAVLEGLAGNPGLPAPLARRLLGHPGGARRVAAREDLTGDLIEAIIAGQDRWVRHALARNPRLPGDARLRLAGDGDPSIRSALVDGRHAAPREVFERLIDDPDATVRRSVAESDGCPADLRAGLARDPDPEVRAALAQSWPQAPEPVRRALLTDPLAPVRAAACATYYRRLPHPVPPPDLVGRLLADPATRAGAVRHASLDEPAARRLARDPDEQVRREMARHPQLPAALLDELAGDPDASVRIAVFARPDTPEPLRHRIHDDIQRGAWAVDEDPDLEAFLREFAVRELRMVHVEWVTADPLPHVSSPYVCFRRAAARSRALPPDAVRRLLGDEESVVRTTMAWHAPDLVDPATAERIDREFRPEQKTRWRPADDFTFPAEVLRRFATDPDPRMRRLAPRDPDLPADLAARLAIDPDSSVRRAVAAHPRLPGPALVSLLSDDVAWVAGAAAASAALPVAEMERLLAAAGL